MPAEMMVLNASSTEISKSLTDDSGTNVYQPVVGFGAVGIKTLNNFCSNSGCREGPTTPVTKPTLNKPSRGYSTKTTLLNLVELSLKKVSNNCFKVLYTEPATGIFDKVPSPNSNNYLPTKFLAIKPISNIAKSGTVKPKLKFIKSCKRGFNVINGLSCFGIDVTKVKTNLLTTDDNQIVVAKGITTNNPAIRSFLRSC